MPLLQDPIKAIEQIEWYIDSQAQEHFPGAYLLAAGNLCRQVLEQILFILAFYSGMPQPYYIKTNHDLRTADKVFLALQRIDPDSGKKYLEIARSKGRRIRKFARWPLMLNKWRKQFNEPSHFRNPATSRNIEEAEIRDFIGKMKKTFESKDSFLITAAVNEILSRGKIKAELSNDPENTPGILVTHIITPNSLTVSDGNLVLKSPTGEIQVVPDDKEVPLRWSSRIIVVQHSFGMRMNFRFVGEDEKPIDISNIRMILLSLARTPEGRNRLVKRLKKLGINVKFEEQSRK